jgi:uncharacterized membrane protein HdeD (DUF308 family)
MTNSITSKRSLADWSGWDYLPGIAFIVIGVLAIMMAPITSLATGIYVGAMLVVAGAFAFVGGLSHIKRGGAWLAALLGLLSLIVGIAFMYNPTAGAVTLVWMIGAWLLIGGVFEFATAFSTPFGRGWLVLVGIVDIALGALLLFMEPKQAFSFLGYYVGISFVFRGLWSVVFVGEAHHIGHTVREAIA